MQNPPKRWLALPKWRVFCLQVKHQNIRMGFMVFSARHQDRLLPQQLLSRMSSQGFPAIVTDPLTSAVPKGEPLVGATVLALSDAAVYHLRFLLRPMDSDPILDTVLIADLINPS